MDKKASSQEEGREQTIRVGIVFSYDPERRLVALFQRRLAEQLAEGPVREVVVWERGEGEDLSLADVVITDSLDVVADSLRSNVPVIYAGLGLVEGAMVRTVHDPTRRVLETIQMVVELRNALMKGRPDDWGPRVRFSVQSTF